VGVRAEGSGSLHEPNPHINEHKLTQSYNNFGVMGDELMEDELRLLLARPKGSRVR
jgi:hypothetical protein